MSRTVPESSPEARGSARQPRCETCGENMRGMLSGEGVARLGYQIWTCIRHGAARSPSEKLRRAGPEDGTAGDQ